MMSGMLKVVEAWVASGALHVVAGAVCAYMFHARIAPLVAKAIAMWDHLRGVAKAAEAEAKKAL